MFLLPTPIRNLWRDMRTRKARTMLVIVSIAIGVLGFSTVLGTVATLQPRLLSAYLSVNPADVTVTTTGVSADTLPLLNQVKNVELVEGVFIFHTRWQVEDEMKTLKIVAVPDFVAKQINQITLEDGAWPSQGSIMLERTALAIQPFQAGDQLTIQTPTGRQQIPVSGIAYDPTTPSIQVYDIATAYMTVSAAETLLGNYDFNELHVRVSDQDTIPQAAKDILETMHANELPVLAYENRVLGDYPGRSGFAAILQLMGFFSLFALGLCVFIVINTIVTIMSAETRQIGTMKALGATRWMIIREYLIKMISYGVLGTILGLLGSIVTANFLVRYMAEIANVKMNGIIVPPASYLLLAGSVGVALPFLAAFYPILRATDITVKEAMISYGITWRIGLIERILARMTRFSGNLTIAMRNTLRSKGRSALTILALTLAGTCFIAVDAMRASLDRTLDVIATTMDADVFTLLSVPTNQDNLVPIVNASDGNQPQVEFWLRQSFQFNIDEALIHGIPKDSTLYDHETVLVDGRWFDARDKNSVLITESFSKENFYQVGDQVTLGIGASRQRWHIIGIVRDFTNQGRLFIVPYSELTARLDMPDQTNLVLVQLQDRTPQPVGTYISAFTGRMLSTGFEADITSLAELRADGTSQLRIIVSFLLAMVMLVALIGILGLTSTLTIHVTERMREIGVMRSIGASSLSVARVFWLEGVCMGLISWILAMLVSIPVTRGFVSLLNQLLLPIEFVLPASSLVLLGVGMLFVVSAASLIPAFSAARLQVGRILRYG